MMKRLLMFAITFICMGAQAETGLFTEEEVRHHRNQISLITQVTSSCLVDIYADHVQFFDQWGVSKYYGDRKPEYGTVQGRRAALVKYGAPEHLISQLEPTSCIGLTMKCLKRGFEAAGQGATWQKIYSRLAIGNKFYGTDLQKMMRGLGWQTLYWNPDVSQNEAWDREDQRINPLPPGRVWNPVWGGHVYRYAMVQRKGEYHGVPIDDARSLINFGTKVPEFFRLVPFFIGTAHGGYHVFPGLNGQVIEAHSSRNLNDFSNLEVSSFNPLAPGGGPRWTRSERYRSGVILVPPGD